jgi:predicted membrane-bound spermidine synthase
LAVVVLISSAAALAVEISAARLMAPLVGMSLFSWTAIISVVLMGFSIGHWVGGLMASKASTSLRATRWLALTLFLAGVGVTLSVALLPIAPWIIEVAGGVRIATVLVLTSVLFLVPSLVAGIVTPLATAIAVDQGGVGDRGRVLSRMFAASAAGAIAGVLLTGYVLVPVLGSANAMALIACVQAALALWVWSRVGGGLIGALGASTMLGLGIIGALLIRGETCDVESQYYCLKRLDTTEITGFPSQGLEIDGWLHSVEGRDGQDRLFIESHDFVDALGRRDNDGIRDMSALFIGGGGLTLPDLWRRDGRAERLVVLEIDPAVTSFATRNLDVEVADPLRVIHADGRAGLRLLSTNTRFDVIYNDAYTGLTMPAHLVTREFHAEIRDRLDETGFYVVNLIDAPREPRFLASLARTLAKDFEVVEVWRRADVTRRDRRLHYGLVARREPSAFGLVMSRAEESRRWERLRDTDVSALINGVPAMILSDDLAPVDRLLANFCSLSFLRIFSLDPSRPDACR